MLIKQLINFFVGKCGGLKYFLYLCTRVRQLVAHKKKAPKAPKDSKDPKDPKDSKDPKDLKDITKKLTTEN